LFLTHTKASFPDTDTRTTYSIFSIAFIITNLPECNNLLDSSTSIYFVVNKINDFNSGLSPDIECSKTEAEFEKYRGKNHKLKGW